MKDLVIKAPAKINLGLNIVSKRNDGFHNLETIFFPVKLYDELAITSSNIFELYSDNKQLNVENTNTILKAKNLLEELTGIDITCKIWLSKNIPIGAGLGGGSSDGASALIGFNDYFSLGLNNEQLLNAALMIGSDVPFFIDPYPKLAFSRGEVFQDIKVNVTLPLLIVNPNIHISTKWAFSSIKPATPEIQLNEIPEINNENLASLTGIIKNDFEEVVFDQYPEVKEIKETLYKSGAVFSLMTGSGSTVFAFFNNPEDAVKAEQIYRGKYFTFLQN